MGFIRKLIKFLSSFIPRLRRKVIFEVRRHDPPPLLKPIVGIRFEQVTAENVALVSHFRSQDVVEQFRKHLAQSDLGMYAFCGDEAVGHAWAAVWHGSDRFVWGYMPVTADTACIYYCSVSPQFRGRNIYQHMLVKLTELVFRSTPVHRILIDSSTDNLPSLSAIQRVRFRHLLVLPVLRWCGRTLRLARIPRHKPNHP